MDEMEINRELEQAEIISEEDEKALPLTSEERRELEQLRREKEKNFKERMYDKVNISVKTLDRIIAGLVILFLVVVIMGMIAGR